MRISSYHKIDKTGLLRDLRDLEMDDLPFERMVGKKVDSVERLSGGINNPCYKVSCWDGTQLIVQLAGDKFSEKTEREPQFVELIQELGVPAPNIVRADATGKVLDRDYLVKYYIKGSTLDKAQENLNNSELNEIYRGLGALLSNLHEKKFENFGRLEKKEQGFKVISSYDSFRNFFIDQIFFWLAKEKRTPFEDKIPDLKAWIKEQSRIFETKIIPRLTHNDLRPDNIIVEGTEIKGIIDLDNLKSSNSISDIYRIYRHFEAKNRTERAVESFFDSYSVDLPQNYEQQLEFYLLIHPLAYIDCWQQIKDSYTPQDLKKMKSYLFKSIDRILNHSFV